MDSKTKRRAVFFGLLILLLVMATVALINYQKLFVPETDTVEKTNSKEAVKVTKDGMVIGADLKAFLQDETFFDHPNQFSEYKDKVSGETSEKPRVYMLLTSVEMDIRATIVDEENNPVTGEEFTLLVDHEEEYQDMDLDGMIHIENIKPGQYQVELEESEHYTVPEEPVEVTVSDSVSYTPITDIRYLIKSEDEIDANAEDTQEAQIDEDDMDATEFSEIFAGNDSIQMGIDVSKWNKEIDWQKVKEEGVDFAIIRCGYRGSATGALVEDPYFSDNLQKAKQAGVKVGIYFFTQATTVVEAVEEASMSLALLNGVSLEYPIFIDTEGAGGNGRADGLSKEMRTQVCDAFCKTVLNAGYTPGIYASRNWYQKQLSMEESLNDYYIWLAEYRETPLYTDHYEMWQYTSSGQVEGIETRVDFNVSYREQ